MGNKLERTKLRILITVFIEIILAGVFVTFYLFGFFDFNENILTEGLLKLIDIVKKYNKATKIIIVPPVKLDKYVTFGFFSYQFNEVSVERSNQTFKLYKQIAEQNDCGYFDFNEIARPSTKDGLHYEPNAHKLIAEKFARYIRTV